MYEILIFVDTRNEAMVFNDKIDQHIKELLNWQGELKISPVGGGSINQAFAVHAGKQSVFVKCNQAGAFPGMFEAEARGLELLRQYSRFDIPEVLDTGMLNNTSYLVMEWIQKGNPGPRFDEDFAFKLAAMHKQSAGFFGLDHDNYIGTLHQVNSARNSWAEFYVELRLEPQIRMARDNGLIDASLVRAFDKLNAKMENLFPAEAPALLHGDLWSGNYMCTVAGEATIFDPAVYYGHREMDLAMSKLFGGFPQHFYDFYCRFFPLENGWEERISLGQLYPLLVHVNLFGSGYVAQLKSCLNRFV